jgi:hypothetical protein
LGGGCVFYEQCQRFRLRLLLLIPFFLSVHPSFCLSAFPPVCLSACALGSTLEVFYELLSFGIPVNQIPVNHNSQNFEFDLTPHRAWVESRRQRELLRQQPPTLPLLQLQQHQHRPDFAIPSFLQTDKSQRSTTPSSSSSSSSSKTAATTGLKKESRPPGPSAAARSGSSSQPQLPPLPSGNGEQVVPRPQDVLLGRLKVTKGQVGNDMLARWIEDTRLEYERSDTTKVAKIRISQRIVEQIKSQGGRFLQQTKYKYGKNRRVENNESSIGWIQVPDSIARQKISHAFRNLRKRVPAPPPPPAAPAPGTNNNISNSNNEAIATDDATTDADAAAVADEGGAFDSASRLSCEIPSHKGCGDCF